MKKLFLLLLCALILFMPTAALATGEDLPGAVEDMINPESGVWWSLLIVTAIIAADTVFGILLGVKNKEFDVRLLPQFLITGVLPFLGSLLILAFLAYFINPFEGMFYTAAVFIVAKYLGDLLEKFKLLFGPKLGV